MSCRRPSVCWGQKSMGMACGAKAHITEKGVGILSGTWSSSSPKVRTGCEIMAVLSTAFTREGVSVNAWSWCSQQEQHGGKAQLGCTMVLDRVGWYAVLLLSCFTTGILLVRVVLRPPRAPAHTTSYALPKPSRSTITTY
mgnify:FL=1